MIYFCFNEKFPSRHVQQEFLLIQQEAFLGGSWHHRVSSIQKANFSPIVEPSLNGPGSMKPGFAVGIIDPSEFENPAIRYNSKEVMKPTMRITCLKKITFNADLYSGKICNKCSRSVTAPFHPELPSFLWMPKVLMGPTHDPESPLPLLMHSCNYEFSAESL